MPHQVKANEGDERARVGLCFACRYARRIRSDRGSLFYFCGRSRTDARFEKYPRLPVISCVGFLPSAESKAIPPRAAEEI
jgi:hypothetical protein